MTEQLSRSRYHAVRQISLIGAALNLMLGIVKMTVGWIGMSHALLADGVHSLADLSTDALVIFAARVGSQAADQEHPYGHGRIETAFTLFLAIFLGMVGIGIIIESYNVIMHRSFEMPHASVLWVALLSVITNEVLFHITQRVAKRIESPLVLANAWHHRSDAASSLVVVLGVVGVRYFHIHYLDAVAAMIVGVMIIKMGWHISWESLKELVDTAVSEEVLRDIQKTIGNVTGVQAVHQLRTRSMGGRILVDAHILVDPLISVSEGHHISLMVDRALRDQFKSIKDIVIHVDHEDDENTEPCAHFPLRTQLLDELESKLVSLPHSNVIEAIELHYAAEGISIDIVLPLEAYESQVQSEKLLEQYNANLCQHVYVERVNLLFTVS